MQYKNIDANKPSNLLKLYQSPIQYTTVLPLKDLEEYFPILLESVVQGSLYAIGQFPLNFSFLDLSVYASLHVGSLMLPSSFKHLPDTQVIFTPPEQENVPMNAFCKAFLLAISFLFTDTHKGNFILNGKNLK